ncbi:Protein SVP26, partial [Termitomyces sp. J132]
FYSYVAVLSAFAFVTLSLASGLLYVSELIEEHSRAAKVYGQRGIYTIITLHFILYFSESLPFPQTAFSIICHVIYLQNFSASWPLISLTSVSFLASCVFVVVDHFLWFFYFSRMTQEARRNRRYGGPFTEVPGFTEIASFFGICVWLVPLFLFLSLSANDNALPVSAGSPTNSSSMRFAQTRVSLFRSVFSLNSLPLLRPKGTRRTEGLLTSHSPNSLSPSIPPPSPTITRHNPIPPPPRSP